MAELLADKMEQRSGVSEMHAAFQLFDSDSKGFISIEDLRNVANELSETVDDEQLLVGSFGLVHKLLFIHFDRC